MQTPWRRSIPVPAAIRWSGMAEGKRCSSFSWSGTRSATWAWGLHTSRGRDLRDLSLSLHVWRWHPQHSIKNVCDFYLAKANAARAPFAFGFAFDRRYKIQDTRYTRSRRIPSRRRRRRSPSSVQNPHSPIWPLGLILIID